MKGFQIILFLFQKIFLLIHQAVYHSDVGLLIRPNLIYQTSLATCKPTYHLDLWNSFSATLAASSSSTLTRLTTRSLFSTSAFFSVLQASFNSLAEATNRCRDIAPS